MVRLEEIQDEALGRRTTLSAEDDEDDWENESDVSFRDHRPGPLGRSVEAYGFGEV